MKLKNFDENFYINPFGWLFAISVHSIYLFTGILSGIELKWRRVHLPEYHILKSVPNPSYEVSDDVINCSSIYTLWSVYVLQTTTRRFQSLSKVLV